MGFLCLLLLVLNFSSFSTSYDGKTRAAKPHQYGMNHDQPIPPKRGSLLERSRKVVAWIRAILESTSNGYPDLIKRLKPNARLADIPIMFRDGVILCHAINVLAQDYVVMKISTSNKLFKQMENIRNFLEACKQRFGVMNSNLFEISDLWGIDVNIGAVVDSIYALGWRTRHLCRDLGIPMLIEYPKESQKLTRIPGSESSNNKLSKESQKLTQIPGSESSNNKLSGFQMESNKGQIGQVEQIGQVGQNFEEIRVVD